MKERKHKRKLNHVLILTSDAADANVKAVSDTGMARGSNCNYAVYTHWRSDRLFYL